MIKSIEKQAREATEQQGSSPVPYLTLPSQAPAALSQCTQAVAPAVPMPSSHHAWEMGSSADLVDRITSVIPSRDSVVSLKESNPNRNTAINLKTIGQKAKSRITGKKPVRVFFDADSLKTQLRENIGKRPYNVEDFYWESGCAQSIARNEAFEIVTLLIIALNSIWLWVDTDLNHATTLLDAQPVFVIVEIAFGVFFLAESCMHEYILHFRRLGYLLWLPLLALFIGFCAQYVFSANEPKLSIHSGL
jgi:hypothetical protein